MLLRDLRLCRRFACRLRMVLMVGLCWLAIAAPSWAGGPRWVTGAPYFTTAGVPVVWYTNQPLYFTDPGDLSSSVNHAAADALVAAAASVWNVPTASLVLSRGGALDEHVSGANTFLGPSGLIFPADVQNNNYVAKQIAVIYDSDWPVMHPIDIICGPYTYQCMPQPFTLRPDDLSALAQLYYMGRGQAPPGKTDTLLNASQFSGRLFFSSGQGMQGVNVVGRRWSQFTAPSQAENWDTVSSVSGTYYRQSNGNPVTGPDTTMAGSQGSSNNFYEGFFDFARVPMLPGSWQLIILETEPINPLYTGQYAVGPYVATVEPSGSNLSLVEGLFSSYQQPFGDFYVLDSASACGSGSDGTEAAPATVDASGWWPGLLCGYGHTAWSSLPVKGNRSLTLEVTAEDEQGFATPAKPMPVFGGWNRTDARGSLPAVANQMRAFHGA